MLVKKIEHSNRICTNLENETPKILWDFEKQIDRPVLARRPHLVSINKARRTAYPVNFSIPTEH